MKHIKIEICDYTYWLGFWTLVVSGIVAITITLSNGYTDRHEMAVKAGYVETTVAGSNVIVWQKK